MPASCSGSIPAALGNLTNLTSLYLYSNQLSGSIPAELGSLANLTGLYLWSNQLSGPIPVELGDLAKLTYLYLNSNQLSGPIPAELGNLASLRYLALNSNQLSGAIPAELGSLANLTYLDLGGNQLSGSIPAELGNLANLTKLYLSSNQLSGSIPAELGNLANLTRLYLWSNQHSGLPDLSMLTALSYMRVENNRLAFEDLEPNAGIASERFSYSPQDSIGKAAERLLPYGGATALAVDAVGTANAYQWAKNGINIKGATSNTLELLDVTLADEGSYTCTITNSKVPDLTLYTRPIHVTVSPPAIAILDFEGMGISAGEALTLSKRIETRLVQLGRHKVIERGQMKRILQEQDFQSLGCTDEECAVEIGQLIGAQQMLAGSIGMVGTVYTIDLKIIDVATGQVLRALLGHSGLINSASYSPDGRRIVTGIAGMD